jgi:hypothetical protein
VTETPRNLYGEALTALDQLKAMPRTISMDGDAIEQQALVKAIEASALASLAAADASLALRDEVETLSSRVYDLYNKAD